MADVLYRGMGSERECKEKDSGKKVAPVCAMQTYIGSKGVAPFILNPGMRCSLVVSFMSQWLYPHKGTLALIE
jgi:hypothetical protein